MNVNKNLLDTLFSRLEEFICTESVVGKPIKIGKVTLIPLIDIGFGAAVGGGNGYKDKKNLKEGGGAGTGAKITPNAVLVVKDGEVSLLSLQDKNSWEKAFRSIPGLISKLKGEKGTSKEE